MRADKIFQVYTDIFAVMYLFLGIIFVQMLFWGVVMPIVCISDYRVIRREEIDGLPEIILHNPSDQQPINMNFSEF